MGDEWRYLIGVVVKAAGAGQIGPTDTTHASERARAPSSSPAPLLLLLTGRTSGLCGGEEQAASESTGGGCYLKAPRPLARAHWRVGPESQMGSTNPRNLAPYTCRDLYRSSEGAVARISHGGPSAVRWGHPTVVSLPPEWRGIDH